MWWIILGLVLIGVAVYLHLKGDSQSVAIEPYKPVESAPKKSRIEEGVAGYLDDHKFDGWAIPGRIRANRAEVQKDILRNKAEAARWAVELHGQQIAAHEAVANLEAAIQETPARLARRLKVEVAAFDRAMAIHDNEQQVIQRATKEGAHASTWFKTEEKRQLDKLELDYKEKESTIKINEHRQMEQINVDMDFKRTMNTLSGILQFKHIQFAAFDEVRGRINSLIEDTYRIENSNMSAEVKAGQLKVAKEAMQAYQEIFNAERRRLMEGSNGQAQEGSIAITDLIGSSELDGSGLTESVPLKKPRSGQRRNPSTD